MIDRSDPRRAAYVAMTEALIEDFRAHNGEVTSGPFAGRTVLLLTTIGAKSGKPRLAPLIYTLAGDGYVIAASSGGSPANPAGFANLVANPVVTVELGGETFTVRARVTEGDERDRLWAEHVAAHPVQLRSDTSTRRGPRRLAAFAELSEPGPAGPVRNELRDSARGPTARGLS
jgi:deazaflavin-dependent oxidoreductase (nitroreductase family)